LLLKWVSAFCSAAADCDYMRAGDSATSDNGDVKTMKILLLNTHITS
jgi:hypothetical protein